MLEEAVLYPARTVDIEIGKANIMSVNVPRITVNQESLGETVLSYGLAQTSAQLDGAIAGLASGSAGDDSPGRNRKRPATCWPTRSKRPGAGSTLWST